MYILHKIQLVLVPRSTESPQAFWATPKKDFILVRVHFLPYITDNDVEDNSHLISVVPVNFEINSKFQNRRKCTYCLCDFDFYIHLNHFQIILNHTKVCLWYCTHNCPFQYVLCFASNIPVRTYIFPSSNIAHNHNVWYFS